MIAGFQIKVFDILMQVQTQNNQGLQFTAFLWDGIQRLEGALIIGEAFLEFKSKNFQNSHLKLLIRLDQINKVEEFRIFEVSRNGVRLHSRDGKIDSFVLDESIQFRKLLQKKLDALTK